MDNKIFSHENEIPQIQIQDPFKRDKLVSISMYYFFPLLEKEMIWDCTIKFKNDNTVGEQRFTDKNFETVVFQMNQFLKNL